MLNKLPNFIDPLYYSQQKKQYTVSIKQSVFLRLIEQVVATNNNVDISIEFYRHKKLRLPAFDLKIKANLLLKCQRSLQNFEHVIQIAITGVFVESKYLEYEVDDSIEVYELLNEKISLLDLIEDELLLAIPLSPIDEMAEVIYKNKDPVAEDLFSQQEPLIKKENPFAALKKLQKNTTKNN